MDSLPNQHAATSLRGKMALSAAALGMMLSGAWYLWAHPPVSSSYYPGCVLHQLTGLQCPGCGGTRCAYALLHLRPLEALHMNALTTLLMPFVGWMAVRAWWRWLRNAPPASTFQPTPRQVSLVVAIIFGFAILRNLPWVPFCWLSPD